MPNVSGRLSFDVVGRTDFPSRAVTANESDDQIRYIVTYQRRNLSDSTLPFSWLWLKLFGLEADLRFVCVAEAVNRAEEVDADLTGYVFVFLKGRRILGKNTSQSNDWESQILPSIKKAQQRLVDYYHQEAVDQSASLQGFFSNTKDELVDELKSSTGNRCSFKICRDGITTIFADQEPLNDSHGYYSQVFFFLKDMVHNHQHHSPREDTIIDLYPVGDEGDTSWASNTLRALLTKIIQFKRNPSETTYADSMGVMAYAENFRSICSASPSLEQVNPQYNAQALEKSISARESKERLILGGRLRSSDKLRSFFLGLLAILISVIGLVGISDKKIPISNENLVFQFASATINNPATAIVVISLVFLLLVWFSGVVKVAATHIFRQVIRTLLAIRRKWAVAFMGLLSVALLYVSWELIKYSLS